MGEPDTISADEARDILARTEGTADALAMVRETAPDHTRSAIDARAGDLARLQRAMRAIIALHADRDAAREELRKLRWCVVANAGRRTTRGAPRWAIVRDTAGVGGTTATQWCAEAGFDPDEVPR